MLAPPAPTGLQSVSSRVYVLWGQADHESPHEALARSFPDGEAEAQGAPAK